MDILSNIPSLKQQDASETSDVDEAAERKKAREQFHKDHVRNGPRRTSAVTNGQAKRAKHRELDGRTKKARKAQVRSHFETMRLAAQLRGHLQTSGILPFLDGHKAISLKRAESTVWIVQRFGVDRDGGGNASFERDDILEAATKALAWYSETMNIGGLQLPDHDFIEFYTVDGTPVWINETTA